MNASIHSATLMLAAIIPSDVIWSYAAFAMVCIAGVATIFLRGDWTDFLVPKLELTGFVLADAGDGSTLFQLEADYSASDRWKFGVLAGGTTGGRRSDYGSLPRAASVLFKATRYF